MNPRKPEQPAPETTGKKVMVTNLSGNVGKSLIARHLLAPRMANAEVYVVETVNAGASDDAPGAERMRGRDFGTLQEAMMVASSAIVDVGASNVEQFLQGMRQYSGSQEDFDLFVVPVTPEKKQQIDTINTVKTLAGLGVEPARIVVIFNKVDSDDGADLSAIFPAIFGFYEEEKLFTLKPAVAIYLNEVYDRLRPLRRTVSDLLTDGRDYRQELRDNKDSDERERLMALVSAKRLAVSAHRNLSDVFRAIFG